MRNFVLTHLRSRSFPVGACALIFAASLSPLACSGESDEASAADHHDHGAEDDGPIGTVSSPLVPTDTIATAVASSTCASSVVKGLSVQLLEEIQCLRPNTFMKIDKTPGLALGGSVMPYLQTKAAQSLIAAQKARGTTMSINSALRTLPQQYLLYRWYQTGRCGIALAASPGTSNHEGGIAVDINDNAGWRSAMQGKSYRWLGAKDPVHYDFIGGGTVNLKGLSVTAFQRLWNRNHPNDTIAVDGSYGPATAARLAQSPIGGFAKGADCSAKPMAGPDAGDAAEPEADPEPVDVPIIPDATEGGDEDTTTSATVTEPITEDLTAPTAEAGGCAVSGARTTGGSSWALALGVAAALVLSASRRRPRA